MSIDARAMPHYRGSAVGLVGLGVMERKGGMSARGERKDRRLDEAARAAWLYFNGGKTQEEIAAILSLSRQAVQRLVNLAVDEKLIRFRLDHRISSCMELTERLTDRYELELCDVAPGEPDTPISTSGVAGAAAMRLERLLAGETPIVLGVGSGRTMRAAVEQMEEFSRPQHKIMALVGSLAADGHATRYDVVMRLADKFGAQRYPVPAPVLAASVEERETLQALTIFRSLRDLREHARACFLGIGDVAWQAPLHTDGLISDTELARLVEAGAVGELAGWTFDEKGALLDGPFNDRVVSLPLEQPPRRLTTLVGFGPRKVKAIRGALVGRLANGLITDEATAEALLESD